MWVPEISSHIHSAKYSTLDVCSDLEARVAFRNICFDDSLWDSLQRAALLLVTHAGIDMKL